VVDSADTVIVVCDNCGTQAEKQAGRLKAERGLVCTECDALLEDHSEKLERIMRADVPSYLRKIVLCQI